MPMSFSCAPQTVGVMFPANRQQVVRWVREAKTATSAPLTPYLAEAVGYADKVGTDIVLALDLTDMLPEAYVANGLKPTRYWPNATTWTWMRRQRSCRMSRESRWESSCEPGPTES